MRRDAIRASGAVLLLSLLGLCAGARFFVSPRGSNAGPCTAPAPCATLSAALLTAVQAVPQGDVVEVFMAAGTYDVNSCNCFVGNRSLSIYGAGADSTIVDCAGAVGSVLCRRGVCCVVRCGVVRCDVVRYDVLWCYVARGDAIRCSDGCAPFLLCRCTAPSSCTSQR
jgi:hypothetical protein